MKNIRRIMVFLLLLFWAVGTTQVVQAQSSDSVYVSETGHWIWGEFLTTYNSVSDPLLYFGYPITDVFTDSATNQQVQYFQRARFDLVETPQGTQIQIAPLGKLLHETDAELADIPNEGPTCRSFNSGYSVCYAFLQYYDAYDGAAHFGSPISEVEVADNHYVQYFEQARMEWWPDRPGGERVVLTDLGSIYFDKYVADPELLKPGGSLSGTGEELVQPVVRIFALRSLIGAGEQQTVYVIAQDQYLNSVQNAQVGVTLSYPDGSKEFYRLTDTNEFGISQFTFPIGSIQVRSTVDVEAEVNVRGVAASGKTSFRIWW